MWRDSSASGSKEKTKITTTSREKNSMALSASLERHSRRMSLPSVASVIDQKDLTRPPLATRPKQDDAGPADLFDRRSARTASTQIRRLPLAEARPGG